MAQAARGVNTYERWVRAWSKAHDIAVCVCVGTCLAGESVSLAVESRSLALVQFLLYVYLLSFLSFLLVVSSIGRTLRLRVTV